MNEWLTMLTDAAQMFLFLAVELSVLFLVISAGVSLIRQKIPDEKIQRMLGARHGKGYLLSALLGAVTPFCSSPTGSPCSPALTRCLKINSRVG